MFPWQLIYDNDKYGHWLPDFRAILSELPNDQAEFMTNNFAQCMIGKPFSSLALALWIECTMNKGTKMKAGWKAILKNEKQFWPTPGTSRTSAALELQFRAASSTKGRKGSMLSVHQLG